MKKVQFTKEDQYLTGALTEHFKNKYGDVAVIAIKYNQIMTFNGGLSSKQTITQLNKLIKYLQRRVEESKCENPNKENKFSPLKLVKRENNDE